MQKVSGVITLFAGVLFTCFLFSACEKEETPISGDSALKIINNCTYSVNIYFDDDFIGEVDEDANRTWSVPTGEHEVRASSYIGGVVTKNPTFHAGMTVIITLSSGIKNAEDEFSVLMEIENQK